MLALLVMMRWRPFSDLPFVVMTKRGSNFGFGSSLVLKGRVSIGHFLLGGVFIDLEGCSEVLMYFLFFLLL